MDRSEAHDHLRLIDNILSTADRTLHISPALLIAIGLMGSVINGLHQVRNLGFEVPPDQYVHLPMLLVVLVIAFATASLRGREGQRDTLADSHAGGVLLVVFVVIFLLNLTAQNSIIPVQAMALFWSGGFSIALLIIGIQSSRVILGGGIALLAGCVAASVFADWFDGFLAIGWLLGFALPGIVLAYGRSYERDDAV